MSKPFGEWGINLKQEKETGRKTKRRIKPNDKLSRKIVLRFLRVQFVALMILLVVFLIVLLAARQYDSIYLSVRDLLDTLFGKQVENWIMYHKAYTFALIYAVFFLISSFAVSASTLHNFNKTWQSLSALLNDDEDVRKFSKRYSDVEIALKDIKHAVYRSKQNALQSEERKNELVMYLAHDLKTPLTSIIGYLTMLSESPELPTAAQAKYIGISLEKAERLEQLISEFFEIARYDMQTVTLEETRFDLCMMLRQIAEEFYPMLRQRGLRVQLELPERIELFADADKLARVFDNLLKNAVTYSYESTVIRIGALVRGGSVLVRVRNRCDRISPEKLERIFEKFYRLDASRGTADGGAGLGLAITKQIVEQHGGAISAYSCDDYTDFTVELPLR